MVAIHPGWQIEMMRLLYRLTLAQVGERIGRSPSWVWKIEKGHLGIEEGEAALIAAEVIQMGQAGEGKRGPIKDGTHEW